MSVPTEKSKKKKVRMKTSYQKYSFLNLKNKTLNENKNS